MSDAKAKITLGGDTAIELDVLKGTLGQDVIDIRSLGSKGVFTFDPGFTSTASVNLKSRLSMVMKVSCSTVVSRSIS
jgi:citrate synthase